MQLIQKLYQPEDKSMPDFDGHPTSGLPCLLARDSGRHLETKGLEREDRKYCGGTLFYDHASG
eukprot:scaffold6350_cov75-Amphora_coffeaeformis.AAC.1